MTDRRRSRQRTVSLRDGAELAFRDLGDERTGGEPLLLVHGFTGSSASWPEIVLARLALRFRVLAVDLIGHGASSRSHDPARFELPELVRDLEELLLACGATRAHWLGYSMGGRITVGACALAPERVASAVLEGSSPGLQTDEERKLRRESDEQLARELETQGIDAFVERWTDLPLFATQRALSPAVRQLQRSQRLANDARSLAACLRGIGTGAQPSFWDALPRLSLPLLLVHGEQDSKFRSIAQQMQRALPQAELCGIPEAGHTTHLERPQLFSEAVLRFHGSLP